MEKLLKVLVFLTVILFAVSICKADNKEYVYNGNARITLLCASDGVRTLKELAKVTGYTPINTKVVYKYGRYWGLTKVYVNNAGFIVKASYQLLK